MQRFISLIVLIIGIFSSLTATSQSGGGFEIDRSTISDAGGGLSQGGDFELHGTIGQADAGEHAGGDITLIGGFWVNGETNVLFKDGFE